LVLSIVTPPPRQFPDSFSKSVLFELLNKISRRGGTPSSFPSSARDREPTFSQSRWQSSTLCPCSQCLCEPDFPPRELRACQLHPNASLLDSGFHPYLICALGAGTPSFYPARTACCFPTYFKAGGKCSRLIERHWSQRGGLAPFSCLDRRIVRPISFNLPLLLLSSSAASRHQSMASRTARFRLMASEDACAARSIIFLKLACIFAQLGQPAGSCSLRRRGLASFVWCPIILWRS